MCASEIADFSQIFYRGHSVKVLGGTLVDSVPVDGGLVTRRRNSLGGSTSPLAGVPEDFFFRSVSVSSFSVLLFPFPPPPVRPSLPHRSFVVPHTDFGLRTVVVVVSVPRRKDLRFVSFGFWVRRKSGNCNSPPFV